MKLRFFDFEVYPNWWCCAFGDLPDDSFDESIKDTFTVVTSDSHNAREELLQLLQEEYVCVSGWNIKGYDLMIGNAIYQGCTPQQVKMVNDVIINPRMAYETKEHMRFSTFAKKKLKVWAYEELMADSYDGSLKDVEGIMGLDIRETEVPFDKEDLTKEDKESIIYYNKHDVYASMVFFKEVKYNYVDSKLRLGRVFDIPEADCFKSTNAILTSKALGAKYTTFPDELLSNVVLPTSIREYVYDSLPSNVITAVLNNPYEFTKEGKVTSKTLKFTIFGNEVVFGNGGLHSIPANNIYAESNDEWQLINMDGASFYPNIMLNFKCLSRAVQDPEKYATIVKERLRLKFKEDKTPAEKERADTYKLVLNTTFGASGNKYLPLYDKYMGLTTCRLGQIILASLANRLYKKIPDLHVLQTNTDGVLIYVKKKYIDEVKRIGTEFENIIHMTLEYDYEGRIWQRDVNNYLLTKADWDGTLDIDHDNLRYGRYLKLCGEWLQYTWRRPGYPNIGTLQAHAAPKAAIEYLLLGKDIVKTILNNRHVEDFAIFCKKGPSFRYVVHRMADGSEVVLNRANRVYATKDCKYEKLYKVKFRKDVKSYYAVPNMPDRCKLINEALDKVAFDDIKKELDYAYYIHLAIDLLDINWTDVWGNPINKFQYEL